MLYRWTTTTNLKYLNKCGVVCIRNMDNDPSRQKEIRSHGNMDFRMWRPLNLWGPV